MADKTPTWGYHKALEAKIFHLDDGEALPSGWVKSPADFGIVTCPSVEQIEAVEMEAPEEPKKRGPGRPPKVAETVEPMEGEEQSS